MNRINDDLGQARSFQRCILPQLPPSEALRFSALYLPAEMVGGDIYDVFTLGPRRYRLFLADATGHGVQASLRTMVLRTKYKVYADHGSGIAGAVDVRLVSRRRRRILHWFWRTEQTGVGGGRRRRRGSQRRVSHRRAGGAS